MAPMIRTIINETVPGALVPQIGTGESGFGDFTRQRSFQTSLLTLFAFLALSPAVGIYGVVHYAAAQRTRDRTARGARCKSARCACARRCGRNASPIGIVLGVIASFVLTRLLTQLVFEIETTDAITFVTVAGTLVGTALVACYAPARRALTPRRCKALRDWTSIASPKSC